MIGRLLHWLFGPRCPKGCGQRVHPTDLGFHFDLEHHGGL